MKELPLEISVDDVSHLLSQPDGKPRMVDCREPDEWQVCHMEGADLVPLSQFGELASQRFSDAGQHVIIYCHHGMRSQRAALWLRQHGFPNVQSLRGGIDAWADLVEPGMARY